MPRRTAATTTVASTLPESTEDSTTDTDTRTYEIVQSHERFRIDVPANWKVTFGPLAPGSKYGGGYALRLYESETKQRAVFVDVTSFRDLSIPYRKYVKNTKARDAFDKNSQGEVSSSIREHSDEWVPVND
jgi:hypothetical protein